MSENSRSGFNPDRLLFVVSQPYLSRKREQALIEGLCAASPIPAQGVRLEGAGTCLPEALDSLCARGGRAILVQPVGLPFSESLSSWLPGALAHWLQTAPQGTDIRIGSDLARSEAVVRATVSDALARSADAQPLAEVAPSLGPRGWDDPGNATDHLLVCSGPRCHFRDAPRLRTFLQDALRRAGVLRHCQVTETSCLGPCNRGPLVTHYPDGAWYTLETAADVQRFVDLVIVARARADDLLAHRLPTRPQAAASRSDAAAAG